VLGRKLNNFLQSIQNYHITPGNQVKEFDEMYACAFPTSSFQSSIKGPASSFQYVH
jgi:hypothetical protein